jgi:hypothetical protein
MARLSLTSTRRKAFAGFGLALFVLGINYCLIGAMTMSGGAMSCMPSLSTNVSGDEMPAAHGGHCAGMATAADEDAPPAAPAPPCCIALTPVVAPELAKVDPAAASVAIVFLEEIELSAAPVLAGDLLRGPPEVFDLSLPERAPTSSRAPPLA